MGCNVILFPFTPIPSTTLYNDNYKILKNKKLKELHPLCYPTTNTKDELKSFIELSLLNTLNDKLKLQKPNFKEFISDKKLIDALTASSTIM